MSLDWPRIALEETLRTSFTAMPVVYDNLPAPKGEFVRAYVEPGFSNPAQQGGGSTNISIGKNVIQRHRGAVSFEINTEKNTGSSANNIVAEALRLLFTDTRINQVTFEGSSIIRTGELDAVYQQTLLVYYYHDNR